MYTIVPTLTGTWQGRCPDCQLVVTATDINVTKKAVIMRLDAHRKDAHPLQVFLESGGKIARVLYKDEGLSGPATAYAENVEPFGRRPFGSPLPAGVFELGWISAAEAAALAQKLGAELVEM